MMLAVLIALTLAQDAGAPLTVNGQRLGDAGEFSDRGPARVCLADLAIDVAENETANLRYAGIHHATIMLTRGRRRIEIAHGDAWARNRAPGDPAIAGNGFVARRIDDRGEPVYLLYPSSGDKAVNGVPSVRISGPGLDAGARDRWLLRRLTLGSGAPPGCDRHYAYGWEMILGDTSVSGRDAQ